MTLTIAIDNGLSCPVVACDVCGERIHDAATAGAYWDPDATDSGIWFVHVGTCARRFDHDTGGRTLWSPLETLLVRLIGNAGLSPRDVQATARRLREMGDVL